MASPGDHFLLPPSPSCPKAVVSPETPPGDRAKLTRSLSSSLLLCALSVISALLRYGIQEAEVGNMALPSGERGIPQEAAVVLVGGGTRVSRLAGAFEVLASCPTPGNQDQGLRSYQKKEIKRLFQRYMTSELLRSALLMYMLDKEWNSWGDPFLVKHAHQALTDCLAVQTKGV